MLIIQPVAMTKLHPLSFPHIFDAIIDFSPPESLPTLRQVCHFFRERADKRLARQLSYIRPGAASKRGLLRSSLCPSVWRPCWSSSPDVHIIDLNFERRGHFLDSRMWYEKGARPRYPNLRYGRFMHASALMSPDPEIDEDMRMQSFPTVIVPRLAECDYSKRRGGMDQVFVHSGTKRLILPTSCSPTDSIWETRLQASPRSSVNVTIVVLEAPQSQKIVADTAAIDVFEKKEDETQVRLPMLEAFVRQLMEEYYAGHLASASLVGLEAWHAAYPHLSKEGWNSLITQRIRETAGGSEYRDFDTAGFISILSVNSKTQWREDVGEQEWELVESSYSPHLAWMREECRWDLQAAKPQPELPAHVARH